MDERLIERSSMVRWVGRLVGMGLKLRVRSLVRDLNKS
jgi:hypothetical protein